MRDLKAQFLVPSHTRPVTGAQEIADLLLIYRDAMQFVHDQTLRYMNQGKTPTEIVQLVKLPPHMEKHDFLQPFYGAVEFSIRAIFNGEMGWFSGRAVDLVPLPPTEKAQELVTLAGGREPLYAFAQNAFEKGKFQWTLELCEHLLLAEDGKEHNHKGIVELKVKALRALAKTQLSSSARNWFLTEAAEGEGLVVQPKRADEDNYFEIVDIRTVFRYMALRLDPYQVQDLDQTVFFVIEDKNATISMHIRNCVCHVRYDQEAIDTETPDFTLRIKSTIVWRDIITNRISGVRALSMGDIKVEGKNIVSGPIALARFTKFFEPKE